MQNFLAIHRSLAFTPKRFLGRMKLFLSNFSLPGTYIAKATAHGMIESCALDQGIEVSLKGSTNTKGKKRRCSQPIQQKGVMMLLGE